jgi:hypothetical protein
MTKPPPERRSRAETTVRKVQGRYYLPVSLVDRIDAEARRRGLPPAAVVLDRLELSYRDRPGDLI